MFSLILWGCGSVELWLHMKLVARVCQQHLKVPSASLHLTLANRRKCEPTFHAKFARLHALFEKFRPSDLHFPMHFRANHSLGTTHTWDIFPSPVKYVDKFIKMPESSNQCLHNKCFGMAYCVRKCNYTKHKLPLSSEQNEWGTVSLGLGLLSFGRRVT